MIIAVQMDNLKGLVGIRRMDKVLNAWTRELCRVTKGVDKRIDGVLCLLSHVERIEKGRIAKRVYIGDCVDICSVSRQQKRWIDMVKDYLRKRGLGIRQARRMVQDRSEWGGVCEGECMGHSPGIEPQTLMRCHGYGLLQLYMKL